MKVRAKWNVRDAAGWHVTGAVFETDEDMGDAVEVMEGPKRRAVKEPEPETAPEPETVTEAIPEGGEVPDSGTEPEAETPKAPEKAQGRSRNSRRKNYSK